MNNNVVVKKMTVTHTVNKWEDVGMIELKSGLVELEFGESYDEEVESAEEEDDYVDGYEEEGEFMIDTEDRTVYCCCDHENNDVDPLLERISLLPQELQLMILCKLNLTSLLTLDLPKDLLRNVLNVPHSEQLEPWLRKELVRQDLGIILVPEDHRLFLSNDEGYNPHAGPLKLASIKPGLSPGLFKVRQLMKGFDLARLDQHFISSKCGPRECFPSTFHKREWEIERVGNWDWAATLISRGFTIQSENRPNLALDNFITKNKFHYCSDFGTEYYMISSDDCSCSNPSREEQSKPRVMKYSNKRVGSVFIISLENGWMNRPWHIQECKSYSEDDVVTAFTESDGIYPMFEYEESRLGVIVNGDPSHIVDGGRVVAYVLTCNDNDSSDNVFSSFEPTRSQPEHKRTAMNLMDDLNEENKNFYISRYGYCGDKELAGFILTGDISYYGRPREMIEEGEEFPDKEFYVEIESEKRLSGN